MKSGWVTKKLGEVCESMPTRDCQIQQNEICKTGRFPVVSQSENFIEGYTDFEKAVAVFPIVLFGDHTCCVKYIDFPFVVGADGTKLLWTACEDVKYLYYAVLDASTSLMDGKYRRHFKDLKKIEMPFPPLTEQKRIVKKIDAAFEKIDALKANAEKNLANAKELFQSVLDEAMRPKKGWVEKRLGEVGEYRKGPFGSSLTKRMFVPKGPTTIKVYEQKNAIRKSATLGEYYITQEYFNEKMRGFEVLPGDVIVSCAGTIGETFIMPENIERGIINQALMRMRLSALIDKSYFLYYFDHILKKSANELSNGSAMKNIPPFSVFKQLAIPVPSLPGQREIVKRLDILSEKIRLLDQNYTKQIADCAEMKQAILKEAFVGNI